MKLKRWLFPVVSAVVLLIILLLFYLAAEPYSYDTGYGALAIMMNGLIFCVAIVSPALSVLYSKICLSDSTNKYYFTLYNSLLLTLPILIVFLNLIVFAFIPFVWCEIWGLIGLIRKKSSEKEETN